MPLPAIVAGVVRIASLARAAAPVIGRVGARVISGGVKMAKAAAPVVRSASIKVFKGVRAAIRGGGALLRGLVRGGNSQGLEGIQQDPGDLIPIENQSDQQKTAETEQPVKAQGTGSSIAKLLAGLGLASRRQQQSSRENGDGYVTYESLYRILGDLSDHFKAFVDNSFSVLLPPLNRLQKSAANLADTIKMLVDKTLQTEKREQGKRREERTEQRNKQLAETDKELLKRIRGKASKTVDLFKGLIAGLFAGTTLFGDKFDDVLKNLGQVLLEWTGDLIKSITERLFPGQTVNDIEKDANVAYSTWMGSLGKKKKDRDPLVEKQLEADYYEKQAKADESNGKTESAEKGRAYAAKLRAEIADEQQAKDRFNAKPTLSDVQDRLNTFNEQEQQQQKTLAPTDNTVPSMDVPSMLSREPATPIKQTMPFRPGVTLIPPKTPTAITGGVVRDSLSVVPSDSGLKVSTETGKAKSAVKKQPASPQSPLPNPQPVAARRTGTPATRDTRFNVPSLSPSQSIGELTFNV